MTDSQILVWSVVLAAPLNIPASWDPAGRMHQEIPQVSASLVVLPELLEAEAPGDHSRTSIGAVEDHSLAVLLLDQAHSPRWSTVGCFIRVWYLPVKCRRHQQ